MAIEEALLDQIQADPRLSLEQKQWLFREIEARIQRREFEGGDDSDDALGALVRRLGPRGPRNQSGAEAQPEESDSE